MNKDRICIIGAGFSGISVGKVLKQRNIPYVCYELSDVIGGLWAFRNKTGLSSAYRSLHIDSSKETTQFPDFPMSARYPAFPSHSQMFDYINAVADHFGLRENVRFNTRVTWAERATDGTWQISLDHGETAAFDYLIVCNGHHWDPRLPDFPGQFSGIILHTHDYKDPFEPVEMRGKRILVVGIGNSALDIAVELSNPGIASRLVLSTRHGAHIVPKYLFGRPVDQVLTISPYLPLAPQRKAAGLLLRLGVGKMEDYGLPRPDHEFLSAHPSVSSEFLYKVANGDIAVKPNIARLDGSTVYFVDGSRADFDAIIYATGYNITFPFFDPDFISAPDNVLPLFKRIFKPGIDNLMFVGLGQALPSAIRFMQDQAEFVGAYLAGEYALPPRSEMERAIVKDARRHSGHFVRSPRHTMELIRNLYRRDLEQELKRGRKRIQLNGG